VALWLLACGGNAARSAQPSPATAGTAGASVSVAGSGAAPVEAEGGAGGVSAGGVSAGGVSAGGVSAGGVSAGEDGGVPGSAGAGGELALPGCVGLACLAGAELLYVPDREWQSTGSTSQAGELAEADYQPLLGPTWRATFSADAQAVDLTPSAGGATVHGTRTQKDQDRAFFELELFAGGRFWVTASASELHAEYTAYGAGAPIASSTRGLLVEP